MIYNFVLGIYEVMVGNVCGIGVVFNVIVVDLELFVFIEVLIFNLDCDIVNGIIWVMGEGVCMLWYSIDGGEIWMVSCFFYNLVLGFYIFLVSYGVGNCVVVYEEEVVFFNGDLLMVNIEVEVSLFNVCDEING